MIFFLIIFAGLLGSLNDQSKIALLIFLTTGENLHKVTGSSASERRCWPSIGSRILLCSKKQGFFKFTAIYLPIYQ